MSDIIDNRQVKLVDQITTILQSSKAARFAVGYFFLSGFTAIARELSMLPEVKLLIGNTSDQKTIDQLAEGYRRLELVADDLEGQVYRKKSEAEQQVLATSSNLRDAIEVMDQTDEGELLLKSLIELIEAGQLKVKIYTKGRLHAKAYIFTYGAIYDDKGKPLARQEKGIGIVGSSNLTLSGVTHNTELNVVVNGNDNYEDLVDWFDVLWKEADDFDAALMDEMKSSWAVAQVRPYDIYMKTLYHLVKDRLEVDDPRDILWDDDITRSLANFQKVAVRQAVQIIRKYRGVFVSDVVGLGKSFIGAAIVKHFERTYQARSLIICPPSLIEMWERYNETYQLNARVLSTGKLQEAEDGNVRFLLDDPLYRDRDFVLVDESHNFRNRDTQRYKVLQAFLSTGDRRCCLLTATPRSKSSGDVYNQIKLFHLDDRTDLPIDPPNLKTFFKQVEQGERQLPELLVHLLVRRTRNHIVRWYGYDATTNEPVEPGQFQDYLSGNRRAYVEVAGKHQFFPQRHLSTIEYSIEDTYEGMYEQIRQYLGKPRDLNNQERIPNEDELIYARYGLWHYVLPTKQHREPYAQLQRAGTNLSGLIRILLFKRIESSVYSFKETVRQLIKLNQLFVDALGRGLVAAGEKAQKVLYEADYLDIAQLTTALTEVSNQYRVEDFDIDRLKAHIEHDNSILNKILLVVEPITPEKDDKLQALFSWLSKPPLVGNKVLIFTEYADTARYLYENLNPNQSRDDVDVIFSSDKNKARAVRRFAPTANKDQVVPNETELSILVTTDVLSEGLNLQDGNIIINYDLHWNPVRLIQRFGRIDRIGTAHQQVFGFNFLPEIGIERNLGLREKLQNRIREIHQTIGEDSAILDPSEQLNPEAMYAIYEQDSKGVSSFEMEDEEEFVNLNEAEEIMRQLKKEDHEEYSRIVNLRDGIRTAKKSSTKGFYVFCQSGSYQRLYLIDEMGEIITQELPRILAFIRSEPSEKGYKLPNNYNQLIMQIKQHFVEETQHRVTERQYSTALTAGQKYIVKELRLLYAAANDEEQKRQISLFDQAFTRHSTSAINKELNIIKKNKVMGEHLLKALGNIYTLHNMSDWVGTVNTKNVTASIPRIICSEALI